MNMSLAQSRIPQPGKEKHPARRCFHLPFPRHNRTAFVNIDTAGCKACGLCVSACPNDVLGIIAFFSHRHVHVDRASRCKGCGTCITTCRQEAIRLSRPS